LAKKVVKEKKPRKKRIAPLRGSNGVWLNTKPFKEVGEYFMKHGYYIADPWGSPAWYDFWKRERDRCMNGYAISKYKITGDYYFYLNYCPIQKVDIENAVGKRASKIKGFPDFWDGDYEYFWFREIARNGILEALNVPLTKQQVVYNLPEEEKIEIYKKHLDSLGLKMKPVLSSVNLEGGKDLILGKARRRGFSYKNSAVVVNNYFTRPNKYNLLMAYEKKYLYPGIKTIFGKCQSYINFINEYTGWLMPSDVIDKQSHIKASYIEYKNGKKIEKGFLSEIEAISFKDNPDAGRGADTYETIGEEVGAWGVPGGLKATIAAMRSSSEAGGFKTGMMTLFGCVCKGTKVYLPNGAICNIEDVHESVGIIGYTGGGVISERIININPIIKKECYRIETTNGDFIECSNDHPLLWSSPKYKKPGKDGKKVTFKKAEDILVGDQLMLLRQIPVFGKKKMPYARLIGLLIGDGYYGSINGRTSTPQLAINNEGVFDYVKSTGLFYKVYKNKGSFNYIGIHSFQGILKVLQIDGQSKKQKRLPKKLYEYDLQSIADLLGGYYDAVGNVNLTKKKNNNVSIAIRLTSVVRPLLEEVQEALRRFGVLSSIIKRRHKPGTLLKSSITGNTSVINTLISYSLEITDRESLRSFQKHISFTDSLKKERLKNYCTDRSDNERQLNNFTYEKTVKGEYFTDKKLDGLTSRKVLNTIKLGERDVYNLGTEETHTYITNNFVSHNTSGSLEKGTADFADLFNRPGANNFMEFYDIWGEHPEKVEGFFFPKQLNTEGFYDKNGNSDFQGAENQEMGVRKSLIEKGATSTEILKRMQEEPLNSAEAFSMVSQNNFPVVEIRQQLNKLIAKGWQNTKGTPVKLHYVDGKITATPILNGKVEPITSLRNLPFDLSGCPVIYEAPISKPPRGLYKMGYDPVRQDTGTSLAAIVVYKSFHAGSVYHSTIVAEYIGRYKTPEDIDRTAEMFADLFNTTIMYENEVTGTKNYFRRIKRLHLLAVQPDAVISKNVKTSRVARVYGCHMNEQLKDAGERYVKEWLLTVLDHDENGNKILVIDRIYSRRLLEELINYTRKGNYDLISSLFMCMFQVQEEQLGKVYGDGEENKNAKKLLNMIERMYRK